jgi:hypothetical protein
MPKEIFNNLEKDLINLENWKKYIEICLEENSNLYIEFEICNMFGKTVLTAFNRYGLYNITKRELLEVINKLMREKSLEYFISTRTKTDSYNYFIVLSIIINK